MKGFFIALQFLTILPIKITSKVDKEDFARSLIWFPFIGALIGLVLSLSVFLSDILPHLFIATLIIGGSIIMTGGVHLDGFADTCDGLYGFTTKERALEIMRDSHIGTMATVGITILLISKFSLLASMPQDSIWKYLVLTLAFARWTQVLSCYLSRYARDNGKAKYFIEYASLRELFIGGIFTSALFIFLLGVQGVILFLTSLILILVPINYIKKKLAGMTGDTIGAINEIAEASVLVLGSIFSRMSL